MKAYSKTLLLGALALTACNSADTPAEDPVMTFTCSYDDASRATDTNFEAKDQIGVYVVADGATLQLGGNEVNNELFSYNGSVWASARKVYWNEGTHTVYAYYPYAPKINDTEDYAFAVPQDQSTHAAISSADFLWASRSGVTASASPVSLKFAHCMSKVKVRLEKSEDFEGEIPADCQVYVHSTAAAASIDLASGGVSRDVNSGTASIHACKVSATEYEAIVVPQNIETRTPLVEVITQGVSYLMEGKISLRQGYCHTIVVTLSKNPTQTKIEIGGSIGGWN